MSTDLTIGPQVKPLAFKEGNCKGKKSTFLQRKMNVKVK